MESHLGRVLVVDDDAVVLRICKRVLGAEGWTVVAADNGRAAITELEASTLPFDCVLSDVNMPELDGYELVQALRDRDTDVPVLLMTGDPSLDGAVRAIDQGAVSYLTKPFAHTALASAVARAARRRRRNKSVQTCDLEHRFARAIDRAWMAFQPIVDTTTRTVFAYEALLRTDEPAFARPDVFIAAAERLDRVTQLGRTVRAAVARAAELAPPDALLFVNVHGLELADESLFAADSVLARHASRVVLEITERTGIDPALGSSRVAMLRRLGYRIAVDDLGAGYAALGALATLEPDIVKLDMSLIRELDRHATKRRIVTAMAALCRELGSRIVAEGVETEAERAACTEAGIDLLQGYLFARPAREFVSVW